MGQEGKGRAKAVGGHRLRQPLHYYTPRPKCRYDERMVPIERIVRLLSEMVRIPSVTPSQAGPRAGSPGEARMAEFVADKFRSLGGEVFQHDVHGRSRAR